MPSGAQLLGAGAMISKLVSVRTKFRPAVAAALLEETQVEFKEVQRITPYDKGDLYRSEGIIGPVWRTSSVYTRIYANTPYALIVHEDPDAEHRPPTQWKYISSVLNASARYMAARIARRIRLGEMV